MFFSFAIDRRIKRQFSFYRGQLIHLFFPAISIAPLQSTTTQRSSAANHKSMSILAPSDPECGNTAFSGSTGFITSPQFPLTYAHNLNCLYSITGGQMNTVYLAFHAFHLEGASNEPSIDSCYSDWITVSSLKLCMH